MPPPSSDVADDGRTYYAFFYEMLVWIDPLLSYDYLSGGVVVVVCRLKGGQCPFSAKTHEWETFFARPFVNVYNFHIVFPSLETSHKKTSTPLYTFYDIVHTHSLSHSHIHTGSGEHKKAQQVTWTLSKMRYLYYYLYRHFPRVSQNTLRFLLEWG